MGAQAKRSASATTKTTKPASKTAPKPAPKARAHAAREAELGSILDAIRRVVRALRLGAGAAERGVGLSGAQVFVLEQLVDRPPMSLGALAAATRTDPSSVSVVVGRLVERGLVARRPDPEDKRKAALSLTAAGRATLRRAPTSAQSEIFAALERLSPAQSRGLSRGLDALIAQMGAEATPAEMFFEEKGSSRRARS